MYIKSERRTVLIPWVCTAVKVFPPSCIVFALLGFTTSYEGFSLSHVFKFDAVGAFEPVTNNYLNKRP